MTLALGGGGVVSVTYHIHPNFGVLAHPVEPPCVAFSSVLDLTKCC